MRLIGGSLAMEVAKELPEHLVLLLIQYPADIPTPFKNIFTSFKDLRLKEDRRSHHPAEVFKRASRGRFSSSRGAKESVSSTARVLSRERDSEWGGSTPMRVRRRCDVYRSRR